LYSDAEIVFSAKLVVCAARKKIAAMSAVGQNDLFTFCSFVKKIE
jgi:hypothetical protein